MSEPPPAKKFKTPTPADKLQRLLETGVGSDFIIKAGDRVFHTHRGIIEQHEYFAAACKKHWSEGINGVFECKEDSADAIGALIHFIYTGVFALKSHVVEDILEHCLEVYVVAHKYMEPELVDLAQRAYVDNLNHVDQSSCYSLIDQARMIYSHPALSQDLDIRRKVSIAIIKYAKILFDKDAKAVEYRATFGKIGGIQVDMALIGALPNSKSPPVTLPKHLFQN